MTKLLTFELDQEKIEIHTNKDGLKYLIDELTNLYNSKKNEHYHLMTPAWGGNELTEEKQNEESNLINHVKIILWN